MMAAKEISLLDSFITKAKNATLTDYQALLSDVAEHTTGDIFDDIERNSIIETLSNNKQIGAGKKLVIKALLKLERDLQSKQSTKGIEGGHGLYKLSSDGVYKMTENDGIRICSKLEVLAMTRTQAGDGWGRMIEWSDLDNRLHRWAIPASMTAGDGSEAIRTLLERGLQIRTGSGKHVLDYLMSVQTSKRLFSTDKTGWHDGAFVTPDQVYGSDDFVFQSSGAINAAINTKSTLQEWRDNVSAQAAGNSRLVFAISTAFAGTLLHGANVDSGGFHFHGNTSDGKSIAQLVAASVWGNPKEYTQSWRATANGLEGIAAVHNDSVLILDEIGQANSKEIGETAYMLANGQGKTRMNKNVTNRDVMTWRLLFLSSGEYTLADMMKSEGKRSFAGQELRLANISSNAGASMGLFENIHNAENPALFAETLKQSIRQYYGTAGDAWLKVITDNPKWRDNINNAINTLTESLSAGISRQAGRVARRFALVAYAGELATQTGITGWNKGEATTAAKICFQSWLDSYGKGNREEHQILEAIRKFIESQGSRFERVHRDGASSRQTVRDRVGFIVLRGETDMETPSDDLGENETWVLNSQLTELAPTYSVTQIKHALHKAGWINSTEGQRKRFGGEKQLRYYKITIPDSDA